LPDEAILAEIRRLDVEQRIRRDGGQGRLSGILDDPKMPFVQFFLVGLVRHVDSKRKGALSSPFVCFTSR